MSTPTFTPDNLAAPKTTSADGIDQFTEAQIRAELTRRGATVPPAGFASTGSHFDPVLDVQWDGPKHVTDTWSVASQWTADEGITYFIDHKNDEPWTPAEVDALPGALAEVKQAVSAATAVQYLCDNHPGIDFMTMTINQVVRLAGSALVPASAMFRAWEILRADGTEAQK